MSQYRFDLLSVDDDAEISPMAPGVIAAMAQKASAAAAAAAAASKKPAKAVEQTQQPAKSAPAATRRENTRSTGDRREPRQPRADGEQRPPRQPRADGEQRPPRQPRADGEQRPPRQPRADGQQRPPRERREYAPRDFDGIPNEQRPARHESGQRVHQRRPPVHGREFDRHSGSTRYDSKKKEVAGASWGAPIDVPIATSVENAITANDEIDQTIAASLVGETEASAEPEKAAESPKEPEEVQLTLDQYLKSKKSKSSLKAKVNVSSNQNSALFSATKPIASKVVPVEVENAAELEEEQVSQQKSKKKKVQRKNVILLETSFRADRGATRPTGPREPRESREPRDNAGGFRERRDENRGERRNNRPRTAPRDGAVVA